eukprot:TRINITY_DN14854_c0_g1_i1.p1 TRINITY_DN14854_c0_g1~~TRINITY_DN14854_c0_g1_i1.p1  ORF type:complete len:809 (+),score=207.73 TRINITY_DN14854_c0_g1_i1:219-2645(+)
MSVKKRIRPGKIEPSVDGVSLVVHFTTELTHLDDAGEPTHVEKSPDKKEVSIQKALRSLEPSGIPDLAREIVQRCKYIPETKLQDVEKVLAKIYAGYASQALGSPSVSPSPPASRSQSADGAWRQERPGAGQPMMRPEGGSAPVGDDRRDRGQREGGRRHRRRRNGGNGAERDGEREHRRSGHPTGDGQGGSGCRVLARPVDVLPQASIDCIDDYAEELYEERMEMKARGAQRLLRLCAEVLPLGEISGHSTLLGVLSRELRENGKRSHELAVAITGIFLCLAHFFQFHEVLHRHRCGDAALRVVEFEGRRSEVLQKELEQLRSKLGARGSQSSAEERSDLEREDRRLRAALERQERLLQLCLLVLRSLSEDPSVGQELVGRLCPLLIPALSRPSEDLLLIALGLLLGLSAVEGSREQIVQASDAVVRLAQLTGHSSAEVANAAMRVCYNLAFDSRGRSALVTHSALLEALPAAARRGSTHRTALRLLYQLSADPALRGAIATRGPEVPVLAVELLAAAPALGPGRSDAAEVRALCVSLAADASCAAAMVADARLPGALRAGIRDEDTLMLKTVRHLCAHSTVRYDFLEAMQQETGGDEWLGDLFRLALKRVSRPEILVEVLGALASLECQSPDVPWSWLCDLGLLDLLCRLLTPGAAEDDVLLEAVMVVGVLALDSECDVALSASRLPFLVPALLDAKSGDCEIVTQVLFTLQCMLEHDKTAQALLAKTDAPARVIERLRGDGEDEGVGELEPPAQAVAEDVLEAVLEFESQDGREATWTGMIKSFRFESHNEEWCESCDATSPGTG